MSLLLVGPAFGQQAACSAGAKARASGALQRAQALAVAVKAGEGDSGVPPEVAPKLIALKAALAVATDAEMACHAVTEPAKTTEAALGAFLTKAAPAISDSKQNEADAGDKPVAGRFGSDVTAGVTRFDGPPRLLEVEVSSSVPCGSDSQLLIYEAQGEHWKRVLRWSSELAKHKGSDVGYAWGDFLLTGIVVEAQAPSQWRAVVAHGNPWCTSRMSGFGLAVIGPKADGDGAKVLWQTDRDYSRGDFVPRLKVTGDTFEFRIHADEMEFDGGGSDAFERAVVYRYRVTEAGVTRLEPVALNGRTFVEEWLAMPWEEAKEQDASAAGPALAAIHQLYASGPSADLKTFLSWAYGPVLACAKPGEFQVAFDSERETAVEGLPGGKHEAPVPHYFRIRQVGSGYEMVSVAETPDASCGGKDLMGQAGQKSPR